MTELQFERVFAKAQDLQTATLTKKEILEAETALKGFEIEGAKKYATTKQAAYIVNVLCMDMSGEYAPEVLQDIMKHYLSNVTIIGEETKKKGIKKESKNKTKKKK